jgi:hypothetical protein
MVPVHTRDRRRETAMKTLGNSGGGVAKELWQLGWGLLFVIAMTVLSECGPRTVLSKQPPAPPVASHPAGHTIK